jgi:hypothetical protein
LGLISASLSAGGSFQYGTVGANASSSLGVDETWTLCFQFTICGQLGFGLQAGFNAGLTVSDENFCEGTTTSSGYFAEFAKFLGGGASVMRDKGGGRSVGGLKGVAGVGAAAGGMKCTVRTVCLN